jgi:hypothetical protein
MPRELFEKDIGELALLFGMIKVGRRLSHCKLNWGDGQRCRQHTKPHWSPKVDPSLLLRSVAFRLHVLEASIDLLELGRRIRCAREINGRS